MPSGEYLRLRTIGRKTGKPHDVIVRFLTVGGKIVVFPQSAGRQDWVANLEANPKAEAFSTDFSVEGTAKVKEVSGLKDPLLSAFTRKYGERDVRKRYWGQRRYVEIEITSKSASLNYAQLVYAELEAAFDGVAENYDHHIMDNEMNLWLRNRSVALLKRLFGPGDTVLEIGCGTGTETLALAEHGTSMIATDISSKMLDVLWRKAGDANLRGRVRTVQARPYELRQKLAEAGIARIDGAYSTYGAINTDPFLPQLFKDLAAMIRPGGHLVLGVWNRYCLYEILGYSIRAKPSLAFARFRNPVPVGKSRFCVASNAYDVRSITSLMDGDLVLREVHGVEIFLPPSNLVHYLPPRPLVSALKRLDVALETLYPWNRLGDHFLAVFQRRPTS
ncbi:MAG TPA: nitroreductase/quinone reductase family protein [Nitrososphaerales archaeon]|nr:nitroreductase/quinone reductase family protein [Nitrososphaerales archaeon]